MGNTMYSKVVREYKDLGINKSKSSAMREYYIKETIRRIQEELKRGSADVLQSLPGSRG